MNRRQFLVSGAAAGAALATGAGLDLSNPRANSASAGNAPTTAPAPPRAQTRPKRDVPDDVVWHDVREWGLEGRAFADTEEYFDRLPARAREVVRTRIWELQRNPAGMSAWFEADTDSIHVRYSLTSEKLDMPHMPATGVSGVDLYGRGETAWHWLGTSYPVKQAFTGTLVADLTPGRRAYHANLPLYNGVKSLEFGVPRGATFEPRPPRNARPICWYGTSITQGGCASRPGMSYLAILGRRLNVPTLNFGFSGSGRMELEVGRFLAELDPGIYVIDCLANMPPELVAANTIPLVKQLRAARPDTPILLLDERPWPNEVLVPRVKGSHREKAAVLKSRYDELVAAGVKNVHFRKGDDVIGADGEGTVDGSHPSDLGMMRYADALEGDLRKLLNNS